MIIAFTSAEWVLFSRISGAGRRVDRHHAGKFRPVLLRPFNFLDGTTDTRCIDVGLAQGACLEASASF